MFEFNLLHIGDPMMIYCADGNVMRGMLCYKSNDELLIYKRDSVLEFPLCELGAEVGVRDYNGDTSYYFKANVIESTYDRCRVNNLILQKGKAARRDVRYNYATDIAVSSMEGTNKFPSFCKSLDISISGICFDSSADFILGEELLIQFTIDGEQLKLFGEVVRIVNLEYFNRYGVQFLDAGKTVDSIKLIQSLSKHADLKQI